MTPDGLLQTISLSGKPISSLAHAKGSGKKIEMPALIGSQQVVEKPRLGVNRLFHGPPGVVSKCIESCSAFYVLVQYRRCLPAYMAKQCLRSGIHNFIEILLTPTLFV